MVDEASQKYTASDLPISRAIVKALLIKASVNMFFAAGASVNTISRCECISSEISSHTINSKKEKKKLAEINLFL